jgi:hypothetical protein
MKTIAVEERSMLPALFGYSVGTKNIARPNIRRCRCRLRSPIRVDGLGVQIGLVGPSGPLAAVEARVK